MSCEVHYVFGTRIAQDLPGYPSGPYEPFVFTVMADSQPHTYESAYALLGFFREQFKAACMAAKRSTRDQPLENREVWIPTCYLDRPTIEVNGEELLLDGEQPHSWLSRN